MLTTIPGSTTPVLVGTSGSVAYVTSGISLILRSKKERITEAPCSPRAPLRTPHRGRHPDHYTPPPGPPPARRPRPPSGRPGDSVGRPAGGPSGRGGGSRWSKLRLDL